MGLDQYLTIRHKSTDAAIQQYNEYWNMTAEQREGLTEPVFPDVIELAYWRKANQIHRWFVENVQNGVDDCGIYTVTRSDLERLLNACESVMSHVQKTNIPSEDFAYGYGFTAYNYSKDAVKKSKDTLPTINGFFFGNTSYNDYYFFKIENTIEQLREVFFKLNKLYTDENEWVIEYQSSW